MIVSAVAEDRANQADKRCKPFKTKRLVFRCVIFRDRTGVYTAECVDLNLVVRGDTPHAAFESLHTAMVGYLTVAFQGDDPAGLVPRPSPLLHRVRYHAYALKAALLSGGERDFLVSDWVEEWEDELWVSVRGGVTNEFCKQFLHASAEDKIAALAKVIGGGTDGH